MEDILLLSMALECLIMVLFEKFLHFIFEDFEGEGIVTVFM